MILGHPRAIERFERDRETILACLRDLRQDRPPPPPGWVWVCLYDVDRLTASLVWTRWDARSLLAVPVPLQELREAAGDGAGVLVILSLGDDITGRQSAAEWVPQDGIPAPPAWLEILRPRVRAASCIFLALGRLGEMGEHEPGYDRAVRDDLFAALERLTPGFGNPDVLGLPRPEEALPPRPQAWLASAGVLTVPVLVHQALVQLGEYPAGAEDYDRAARDLLHQALTRLAPAWATPLLGLPAPTDQGACA